MKEYDPNEFTPTRAQIEKIIWEHARFNPQVETVALDAALGRVSAADVRALRDLPTTTNCRWDGVSVRFDDFEAAGGAPDTSAWVQGRDWVFGNTGIALADGFDTHIRIEDVEIDGQGALTVKRAPAARGEYTTPAGSTMHAGDLLVPAHQTLGPCHLGLIAMGGHARVEVFRKPVVAIIPSGNELVAPAMALPRGKNVETNALVLAAKVRTWGGEPLVWPIVPDDFDLLLAALEEATRTADLVLFNAGSSKGTDDHAEDVLKAAGTLLFHRTSYGPGNHTGFCVARNGTPVLALVGVPGGAEFNAEWYGGLLMHKYFGQTPRAAHRVQVELVDSFKLNNFTPVQMYLNAFVYEEDGRFKARLVKPFEGFAASYAYTNAFILVEPEWGGVEAGQTVTAEMRLPWAQTVCPPLSLQG